MKPIFTVACIFLIQLRRLSSLRPALTALLFAPLATRADLVAHFRFDDDLKDVTGQHDGRPVDPKLAPSFAPGRVGNAVVIEKVNAGIELANPSAINFSRDFTLATWVKKERDMHREPMAIWRCSACPSTLCPDACPSTDRHHLPPLQTQFGEGQPALAWLGRGRTAAFDGRSTAPALPGNLAVGSIADPPGRFAGRVKTQCAVDRQGSHRKSHRGTPVLEVQCPQFSRIAKHVLVLPLVLPLSMMSFSCEQATGLRQSTFVIKRRFR